MGQELKMGNNLKNYTNDIANGKKVSTPKISKRREWSYDVSEERRCRKKNNSENSKRRSND